MGLDSMLLLSKCYVLSNLMLLTVIQILKLLENWFTNVVLHESMDKEFLSQAMMQLNKVWVDMVLSALRILSTNFILADLTSKKLTLSCGLSNSLLQRVDTTEREITLLKVVMLETANI